MSYLLDTNVISELPKRRRDERVVNWFKSVRPDEIHLSVLVLGEARYGVERLRRRDQQSAGSLDRWLREFIAEHADRILDVTREIAEIWGHVRAPRPLPAIDSLLAATALAHDLTLVTRNVQQLEGTGVRMLNPFEPA